MDYIRTQSPSLEQETWMSRLVTHRTQDKSRAYLDVERPLGTVGMECGMYIEQVVACLLQEVTDLDVAGALRVYVLADLAALADCFAGLLQTTTTDGNT